MGLILSAMNAVGSTLADQWKEYIYCDAIPADKICVRGHKHTSGFGGNLGSDNVITDGSAIVVADGQCMLIVEQGQVVDICAEPGVYTYDSKTEPSVFTGSLSESVKNVFATIGRRFEFGGEVGQDQRVYYFNTKELTGQKYGTANPIPFRVVDKNANIDLDISLKCFGEYSLKVVDPVLFYTNVSANHADDYSVEELDSQLRSELLTALQPAFAMISEKGIRYSEIPAHTTELADLLNEELSAKWRTLRGIEIVSLGVSSIKASEEDEKILQNMQVAASYKDPSVAAANLAAAQADSMREAAKNDAGAAVGFMGMNAAQAAGGIDANQLYAQATAQPQEDSWTCEKCGATSTGNFCATCGAPKPTSGKWICPKCGKENDNNFCTQCGEAKPQ